MIYPYVGDFLINPVPLQLSFNWCSHACSYCFANLNSPDRTFDLKDFQQQLKGLHSTRSLQSILMRDKYPVVISNLVDPFATSNYQTAVPVIEQLTAMGVPVALQTRGGRGVDEVLSFLPKSVWYISIPIFNDEIRKRIEPAAPSIPSRIELIQKLRAAGHEILVGINPTVSDWLPGEDGFKLVDTLKAIGVHGIWVAALHFNTRQVKTMPMRDKHRLGEPTLHKGLRNARELQQGCFDFIDGLKEYAVKKGLWVEGLFEGEENHFFDVFYSTYQSVFPTIHHFINWCWHNKQDNEQVYYHEFEKVMTGLPSGKFNVSPYMRCMNQKLDEEIRATEGYKQSFSWLLNLCWNELRMKRTMERYWSFAVSVNYDGKEMRMNRDQQGNTIYHFNRQTFDEDFFIVNQ